MLEVSRKRRIRGVLFRMLVGIAISGVFFQVANAPFLDHRDLPYLFNFRFEGAACRAEMRSSADNL